MAVAYVVLADLYAWGISDVACGQVGVGDRQKALNARCDFADSKCRGRYKLPFLTPYPDDFKMAICHLAAWDVWLIRGGNPDPATDRQYAVRGQMALDWFDGVERQRIHPLLLESTGPETPAYAAPEVISKPIQGWYPGTRRQ